MFITLDARQGLIIDIVQRNVILQNITSNNKGGRQVQTQYVDALLFEEFINVLTQKYNDENSWVPDRSTTLKSELIYDGDSWEILESTNELKIIYRGYTVADSGNTSPVTNTFRFKRSGLLKFVTTINEVLYGIRPISKAQWF